MSVPRFTIRLATNADKVPVLAFCTQTWEHGDYIPDVWTDWLDDPRSSLLVGLLDQQRSGEFAVFAHPLDCN